MPSRVTIPLHCRYINTPEWSPLSLRGEIVRFRLIPLEERFFEDFVGMAEELRGGARLLKQMLAVDPPDASKADAI